MIVRRSAYIMVDSVICGKHGIWLGIMKNRSQRGLKGARKEGTLFDIS